MATGVPKKRHTTSQNQGRLTSGDLIVRLQYEGKKSETEILSTPPAEWKCVWDGHSNQQGNHLFYGDNLGVLSALQRDPTVVGQVRLIYIDPPYATQTVFHSRSLEHAYEDTLSGAEFVEFLRERLILLRELLAEDGSIYLHLDEKMIFHAKLLMDEVFGGENYRNLITRKKSNPKNTARYRYGNVSDYILFYTKGNEYIWNRPFEPWTEATSLKEYSYFEPETGRRYKKVPIHAPGIRNGETGKPWRGMLPPPGKHWQYLPSTLDEMDARGEIYWSPNGNPRRKIYLDQSQGNPVQDVWLDFKDAHNQNIEITGYPTEKNPELLRRIIHASSNPGDLVLDCFSGSGTTLAVADSLKRQWIGVDNSIEAIKTTLKRFHLGTEKMGDYVSKPKNQSDDSFVVTPMLFEEDARAENQDEVGGANLISDFKLYVELGLMDEIDELRAYLSDLELKQQS